MPRPKSATSDRHRPRFMVGLPGYYRGPVERLSREQRRSLTTVVQLAVEAYCRTHKVPLPAPEEARRDRDAAAP